jgi:hypothetical protein
MTCNIKHMLNGTKIYASSGFTQSDLLRASLLPSGSNFPTWPFLRVRLLAAKFRVQHVRSCPSLSTRIPIGAAPTLILEVFGYKESNI